MNGENSGFRRFWSTVKKYARRVWAYLKVAKMEYIVMISLFALDLISKAIVNATTYHGEVVVLIPNFLNIHNSHNYAAAFGNSWLSSWMGNMGARIFFSIFAVAASVAFVIILIKSKRGNKLFRVALAMLTAGAMGNCIDRMFLGYVRDFVEFVYFGLTIAGSKSFYIFNIADAELVIGVILMIVYFLFIYRDKDDKKHAEEAPADGDGQNEIDVNADGEPVAAESQEPLDNAEETPSEERETETPDPAEAPTGGVEQADEETETSEPEQMYSEADGE